MNGQMEAYAKKIGVPPGYLEKVARMLDTIDPVATVAALAWLAKEKGAGTSAFQEVVRILDEAVDKLLAVRS